MAVEHKTVTLDGLKALNEHNKKSYMPVSYNENSSVKQVAGNVHFHDLVETGALIIGNIELLPTEDALEIRFLNG